MSGPSESEFRRWCERATAAPLDTQSLAIAGAGLRLLTELDQHRLRGRLPATADAEVAGLKAKLAAAAVRIADQSEALTRAAEWCDVRRQQLDELTAALKALYEADRSVLVARGLVPPWDRDSMMGRAALALGITTDVRAGG